MNNLLNLATDYYALALHSFVWDGTSLEISPGPDPVPPRLRALIEEESFTLGELEREFHEARNSARTKCL